MMIPDYTKASKTTPCTMCLNYLTLEPGFAECDYDVFPRSPIHKAEMNTPMQLECPYFEFAYEYRDEQDQ